MIDEKKLIEEIEKHRLEYKDCDMGIGINVVKELIENQPKVGEWIPCSAGLPNESFEKLEWILDEDGELVACDVLVTACSKSENNKLYVTDAMYFCNLNTFTVNDVVAWMVPEPYTERR